MMKPKQLNAASVQKMQHQKMQHQKMLKAAKEAEKDTCQSCGNTEFLQLFILPRISRFVAGTPKDVVIPQLSKFVCSVCGRPWDQKVEEKDGQNRENNNEGGSDIIA